MSNSKVLVYMVRRDLRVSDNPVLHSLATSKDHGFTHLLPLYVFNAQQLEISGFLKDGEPKSPYREARSQIGGFWRCGPHRAKFLAECIWDLKTGLEKVGSSLCIRVGMPGEIVNDILTKSDLKVDAVWMVAEEGVEENREERSVRSACRDSGVEFKLWTDEKYLIDDRDLPLDNIEELSDVFTTYRKTVEPLRNHPRPVLPSLVKGSLPPYPPCSSIPDQYSPFTIPTTEKELQAALLKPLVAQDLVKDPPTHPEGAKSAHPFQGGETHAQDRLNYLITSGSINTYHETRNGLLGEDFSTKLSAYLVLGCITSRQIHESLRAYEDGTNPAFAEVEGYGKGQPEKGGTYSIRFELLWRDYMRLCTRKFGAKLFRLSGFKAEGDERWRTPDQPLGAKPEEIKEQIERFLNGTTGMGLIDASLRELYHTGYTSNRARQNVASFLAKHLKLDWRVGAEWYECMLVDYDLSSNWGNWQYLAGVGNDPRGEARIFNPVKQAFDYDPQGEYVKAWVPETRGLTEPSEIFQPWTVGEDRREELGLKGLPGVEKPLLKIDFTVNRRGRHPGRPRGDRGTSGHDRGGRGGGDGSGGRGGGYGEGRGRGAPHGYQPRYNTGRGFGSSRGGYARGGYYGGRGSGGRDERRMGMMDREIRVTEYAQAQYL
ncbi:related to cryptochrome DASH [Phialocephala subalpina]|uniref:Cryptochrome DASH n=1 Tax=Phialocephala subalpina TaxID=576137 RepID=A0A1L7WFS9_9HELO|nr:related to cryptochrome DASH [Phialocephala subalpina]